jgi:hypothetical protein
VKVHPNLFCYNDWWVLVCENLEIFCSVGWCITNFLVLMTDEDGGLKLNRDGCSIEVQKRGIFKLLMIISLFINISGFLFVWSLNYIGRMRSLLNLEKRERSLNFEEPRHRISHGRIPSVHVPPFSGVLYCFLTLFYNHFIFFLLLFLLDMRLLETLP